jgi:hypothetical protein
MTKQKKPLMIPFDTVSGNMLDYTSWNYEYDNKSPNKIWFDTETKKSVWQPWPAHESRKEFDDNVASGKYIEINSITWKENHEFTDTLEIVGFSRGRSAANFNFKSTTNGMEYNTFMTDVLSIISKSVIDHGVVTGTWTFVKRGANYGIKLVDSE